MAMIDVQQLFFQYKQKNPLFSGINLMLEPGHIYGLLGKNGAGKTSLLKLLAGLIFPTNGTCLVWNKRPGERLPSFLQDIYFLPEDLFVPALTVKRYIQLYAPFYERFDHEQLQLGLHEFGLSTDQLLSQLSYGQKKKFLLAFGLATQARLLILDEPTNGLDIPSKIQFRKLIATHACASNAMIISTHQVHDIEHLVDGIVILEQGKILLQASLEDITKVLQVEQCATLPDTDCLYYEKKLQGYQVLTLNTMKNETHIDLEILFNAVLSNHPEAFSTFLRGSS